MKGFHERMIILALTAASFLLSGCGPAGKDLGRIINTASGMPAWKEISMEAQNMSEEKGLQPDTMQEPAPAEEEAPETAEASPEWPDWARAYWEFIFNGRYSFDDFAVSAVGLLDLNQDETPELVLYHYSSGSLGGWYSFYYYNGSEAVPVLNQEGEAVVCGTHLYLYYYPESRKLMMYHRMSIILGNYQGSYGYVREVEETDGAPSVRNIIRVRQHPELTMEIAQDARKAPGETAGIAANREDALVSNELLALAEKYENGQWETVSGEEYICEKYQLIPLGEIRRDYWGYGAEVTMSAYFTYQWQCAEDEDYRVLPTKEEFEELLTLWEQGAEKREELAAV